jgi:hypothetical protein
MSQLVVGLVRECGKKKHGTRLSRPVPLQPGLAVGARQQLAAVGAKRLGVMLGMALVLENVLRVQKGQGRSGCVRA